jgi:uncharacterized protein YqfB (UPF0267 family)
MKALDEMVKRHKQEEEMFIAKFKQGLDNITKDHVENQSKNIDKLKASIKK